MTFGAREGSRGWVTENFVYHAGKLGFYSEGEVSVLRELALHFILNFLRFIFQGFIFQDYIFILCEHSRARNWWQGDQ